MGKVRQKPGTVCGIVEICGHEKWKETRWAGTIEVTFGGPRRNADFWVETPGAWRTDDEDNWIDSNRECGVGGRV